MKLFVLSDPHSYFKAMKKALDEKGFEDNNPEHLLIICGDVFDRGPESAEMLDYLNNLTNVVLVKGNHEDLMEEVWERGYCQSHDQNNGTLRTINDLFYAKGNFESDDAIELSEKLLRPFFDKYVNYFETKNYVFVHGWIPCDKWEDDNSKPWYQRNRKFKYDPDWRNANNVEWYSARWINGINAGYIVAPKIHEPGKTIVCGHWHCSYAHYWKAVRDAGKEGKSIFDVKVTEFEDTAIWEPFIAEGIMAIDRCTAHTGEVNVVVLEDELLDESVCTNI